MVSGLFRLSTGVALRSLDSRELFEVGFALMMERSVIDRDTADGRERFMSKFKNLVYEETTGMPAITQWMAPADGGG